MQDTRARKRLVGVREGLAVQTHTVLLDQAAPLAEMLWRWLPANRQMCRDYYGCEGAMLTSGVDFDGTSIRKGAPDTMMAMIQGNGSSTPADLKPTVDRIARAGGTPLVVMSNNRPLGVIHLKDIVKGGIKERFAQLRGMGIKTVMITGDNPLTAAAIAAEAGVDDFLAQATPEAKLKLIRDRLMECCHFDFDRYGGVVSYHPIECCCCNPG